MAEAPVHRDEYPADLANAETALVDARRQANGSPTGSPRIGVGLSGGGIRSATFCLGVFQALAEKRGELLKPIDYLSTVSGGGYFGSFFGRLFARDEVAGVADVAKTLLDEPLPKASQSSFRFLRDNGRYLAPRGSGDLLALIAVTLRNWVALQIVLMTFVLAAFVALQYADIRIRGVSVTPPDGNFVSSPVFWFLIPVALLWVIPTGWAYWVIGMPRSRTNLLRRSDLLALVIVAGGWALGWIPQPEISLRPFALGGSSLAIAAAAVAVAAVFTTLWSFVVNFSGIADWFRAVFKAEEITAAMTNASRARNRITRWLKRSLMALAVIGAVGLVDSLGATSYAIFKTDEGFANVTAAAATLAAGLGGFAAFGRQLLVVLGGEGRAGRPVVSLSIVTWVAALVIVGCWLTALNGVAHAVAWGGEKPPYAEALFAARSTKVFDAAAIEVTTNGSRQVIRALDDGANAAEPGAAVRAVSPAAAPGVAGVRDGKFAGRVLLLLLVMVFAIGKTRTFLNASSLHTFYSQRLTRAYLGASNVLRLQGRAHLSDVIHGDDLASTSYWHWPALPPSRTVADKVRDAARSLFGSVRKFIVRSEPQQREPTPQSAAAPITNKGGPLHVVNVTINETLDNRTGVQRQDRKGVPMAVGPCGLSVGARHHLVSNAGKGFIAHSAGGYLFRADEVDQGPEELTLGRWVSISGAAFSSAIGARTTVPIALLCTFANVRLGYWWDSGFGKGMKEPFLPVYSGLLAESIGRLRGTGDRYWNVSDGGHFENLAGYELIRRRLPLIILIDAEADPDFEFPGLSELIRKARLDFDAEIEFLGKSELPEELKKSVAFTSLQGLRRSSSDAQAKENGTTLSTAADRRKYSSAHAALATVKYKGGATGWLVYVKASVDGDEPADVLQYHAKHPDFPHEPTSDQFFDEAQWESYRRLGQHIGEMVWKAPVFALASAPVPGGAP